MQKAFVGGVFFTKIMMRTFFVVVSAVFVCTNEELKNTTVSPAKKTF